jgi:phosphoglycerate dehydrogenase-like enzyme
MALTERNLDVALIGDFQRRIQGFGHVGKEVGHFVTALHIKFIIIKTEMRRVIESTARRNTELDLLGSCIAGVDVMIIVGSHQL